MVLYRTEPWTLESLSCLRGGGNYCFPFLDAVLFVCFSVKRVCLFFFFLTPIELVTKTGKVFIHMWPFGWLSHLTNVLISSFFPQPGFCPYCSQLSKLIPYEVGVTQIQNQGQYIKQTKTTV